MDLKLLKKEVEKDIEKIQTLNELNELFKKFFGKKGEITRFLHSLKELPKEKRVKIGKEINNIKQELIKILEEKKYKIQEIEYKIQDKWFDISVPGKRPILGHLHPLTLVKRKIMEIFQSMGFSVVEGPEVENEWYNFDALNIPKDHPARDMWDTLWLKEPTNSKFKVQNSKLLLRTHTSPVQIRYMEKNNPPLKIIAPGRVFRYEATDASHEVNFYQIEGLMLGESVSIAYFKAVIQSFFQKFFEKPVIIRLRPSYFPFVEPGFEIDISCLVCGGKKCSSCQRTGWLEIAGAGMVHPNVIKNAGLNPKFWQGFAFGMGMDRLAMMKYKINDIRLFYSGDLKFLNQF